LEIKYCERELLELFGSKPYEYWSEGYCWDASYKKKDEYGVSLFLSFGFYEDNRSIGLSYKDKSIVYLEMNYDVTHFECTKETLIVRRDEGENEVLVRFKPHLSIKLLDENMPEPFSWNMTPLGGSSCLSGSDRGSSTLPIKYCEYELLELFESEPIIGSFEHAGEGDRWVTYSKEEDDLSLRFSFDVIGKTCSVSFSHPSRKEPIFEFGLTKIIRFECTKEMLIVRREDGYNEVLIKFKPHLEVEIIKEEEFTI